MEGDIPEETAVRRSDLGAVFGELPLFKGLDYSFLRQVAQAAEWLSLPGGAMALISGTPDAIEALLQGADAVIACHNGAQ